MLFFYACDLPSLCSQRVLTAEEAEESDQVSPFLFLSPAVDSPLSSGSVSISQPTRLSSSLCRI